jgi:hypothetical protein
MSECLHHKTRKKQQIHCDSGLDWRMGDVPIVAGGGGGGESINTTQYTLDAATIASAAATPLLPVPDIWTPKKKDKAQQMY